MWILGIRILCLEIWWGEIGGNVGCVFGVGVVLWIVGVLCDFGGDMGDDEFFCCLRDCGCGRRGV